MTMNPELHFGNVPMPRNILDTCHVVLDDGSIPVNLFARKDIRSAEDFRNNFTPLTEKLPSIGYFTQRELDELASRFTQDGESIYDIVLVAKDDFDNVTMSFRPPTKVGARPRSVGDLLSKNTQFPILLFEVWPSYVERTQFASDSKQYVCHYSTFIAPEMALNGNDEVYVQVKANPPSPLSPGSPDKALQAYQSTLNTLSTGLPKDVCGAVCKLDDITPNPEYLDVPLATNKLMADLATVFGYARAEDLTNKIMSSVLYEADSCGYLKLFDQGDDGTRRFRHAYHRKAFFTLHFTRNDMMFVTDLLKEANMLNDLSDETLNIFNEGSEICAIYFNRLVSNEISVNLVSGKKHQVVFLKPA